MLQKRPAAGGAARRRAPFLMHLLFNVLKFIMKVCEKQGRIKYGRKSKNQDPEIHGRK